MREGEGDGGGRRGGGRCRRESCHQRLSPHPREGLSLWWVKQQQRSKTPSNSFHLGPKAQPASPPFHPTHQDDRIPAHRKTTGTKVLENRNCWDYKGTHFIHTNWSFERPCESFNCSVQIFRGGEKPNPLTGGVFPPLLVCHSIFFSLRFGTGFPIFSFLSIIGACSGWKPIHAPSQAGGFALPRGWTFRVETIPFPPFDRTCVCVFHFKLLSDGYEKRKRKNRDSCGQG